MRLRDRRTVSKEADIPTSFELGLKNTLTPEKAFDGTATNTRSSTATVVDFEGLIKNCKAGEIRETGARRVENLITSSSVLVSGNAITLTLAAGAYVFSMGAGASSGVATFSGTGGATGTLMQNATQRVSDMKTISAGTLVITASVADLNNLQVELVSGQTNQNPSEYVTSSETSVGATGVKYFPYQNGNTVSNNIVTEAQGVAIPATTLKGGLIEPTDTNYLLQSADFNTTWSHSNTTVSDSGIASPIQGRNWQKLTRSNTTASSVVQSVTGIALTTGNTFSVYLKLGSGAEVGNRILFYNITTSQNLYGIILNLTSGNVSIIGGTGKYSITNLGGNAYKVSVSNLAGVTNGDTIRMYVCWTGQAVITGEYVYALDPQLNKLPYAPSLISTTTTAVTRSVDLLSYPATNLSTTEGAIYLEFTPTHNSRGTVYLFGSYVDTNNYTAILHDGTSWIFRKRVAATNYDATLTGSFTANYNYRIAISYGPARMNLVINGTISARQTDTTALQLGASVQIGADGNSLQQPTGCIKNIKFYQKALSTRKMQKLTQ